MTMRNIWCFLTLLFVLTNPGIAYSQWSVNGKPVPDISWMKSVGDFNVELLLTKKHQEFLENWEKPIKDVPIVPAYLAHRSEEVAAILLMTNCAANNKGECHVTVDLSLFKPDGSAYGAFKKSEMWWDKPAGREGVLILGVTYMVFVIEPNDPLGDYRFFATITDDISGIAINLESNLSVTK